jgi:hypothetical protein
VPAKGRADYYETVKPVGDLSLDFWKLDSAGFVLLKNTRKQGAYMRRVASEIDRYIKSIQSRALAYKNNNEPK